VRSWLTGIAGTRFNQTLAYNAAVNGITPSVPRYNGNIGALKWKAGDETIERGYQFTYDGLNRLTAAAYGEGTSLTSNLNRFNEAVIEYDKAGNIKALERQGKLDGGYGMMDNLTYTYTGNKLTKVTDAVTTPITYTGAFHFADRANVANEYTYDQNGNATKDLNRNITSITYNALNLPSVITFADGNTITYGYNAAGSKLSVAYTAGGTTTKTEYAGNKVYKNGTLSMILTEEGYVTLSGTTPTYHYYLKDHQGNNRVVLNQSGTVEQVNHYYPFGGLFGEGLQVSNQPYRYNGKELDRELNLDLYDYGARHYDAALAKWLIPDPLAEKYYSISQYAYVANNPVNFIDPDGRRERPVNPTYNGYGRRHENNFGVARPSGRTHKGVDINHTGGGNTDKGAPIIATHDGTITRVVSIGGGDKDAGGNRVQITSSDGSVSTYYMHLDAVSNGIQTGTVVTEGQQIGTMGGSGKGKSDAYTSHLHYEVKIDGVKVDPATSAANLIDPQQLITPVNGGTLPEVVVTAPKPVQVMPVPEIKPLSTPLPDKLKIQLINYY
jgi:RHS repeat-associated protein